MTSTIRAVTHDLRPIGRPARVLYAGAALWLASGLVHIVVLAVDGWAWSGAVSFRKPMVFSLSVGLLLATAGWVLDRLPSRRRLAPALAWTLVVSSTIEVALIAVQAWRGRASHFNVTEPGDAAIFAMMGVMVGVMSLCLVTLLVWSLIERPIDPLVRWAVIGGLLLVTTGLGIGQWIVELGNAYVATNDAVPQNVVNGEEGLVKFPHAVAFHGIQAFIVAAVALRRGGHPEARRRRLMRVLVVSYGAALVFASVQTVVGRGPLDPTVWNLGLVASLVVIGMALVRIARGLRPVADREEPVPVA